MGKGDKKTRRGKIINGTYGVRRPRSKKATNVSSVKKSEEKK
jgi:30S ribosomal protein S31